MLRRGTLESGVRQVRGAALRSLIVLPVLAYLAALTLLYARQESMLFLPEPLPAQHRFALPGVEELHVPVDGAVLHALHFRQPQARGVIFYLHGNAGNVAQWLPDTRFYERVRYDVVMLDYRGYGKSTGRIQSEAQLHADVRALWDRIAPQYEGRARVILGRSLGTGLAARLASEVSAELLVLTASYSSMRQLAAEKYPWAPTVLLRYPLPTDEWLPRAKMAVLIAHGEDDGLIPIRHAERLAALRPDAQLLRLPGTGHNDIGRSPVYVEAFSARLEALGASR